MADAGPPPGANRGPFVGRDVELARIRALLDAARSGSGGLVLVSGPAGIGKTRTVEESLEDSAVPVVWGRCVDDPGAPPLWPWRRVLRARPEVATAVGDALAALDRTPGATDPEVARFRFVTAATEALVASAERTGLAVVLEDLHWADPASVRLLRHLTGELHRSRLLVLGTVRDPAGPLGDSALADALPDLLRWPGTELLELAPLAEDDVRSYLAAVAPDPLPPDTVRGLHRRCGGNPLYLRALTAAGVALPDAPASAALRHAVRAALAALPPDVVDLLTVAAVLGEEVSPALLAAVTARSEDDVRTALDAAVRTGVLTAVPDSPGRRRFVHAVVRDGIYADLAPSDREVLHRRVAEAWETVVGVDDTTAGVVAGHWLRAAADPRTLARAAGWARRASAAATRSLAFEEAASFLRTALDAAERAGCDAEERAVLLVEVAGTEFRAGRFAESLAHAVAASEAAGGSRPDLLVAAALTVHDVAAPDFPPAVVAMCERALAAPDVARSPVLRARLLAQMASASADAGRLGLSSDLSTTALELAEEAGDPEAILDAVRARMKVSVDTLPPAERLRLGRLAIEHAGATGQPLTELWGAKWRIDAALETGDLATTEEELTRVSALARRTGLPLVRWHDLRLRASVAALVGRFPEALALNEQARDLGARDLAQDLSTAGMSGAFLMQHALITGDLTHWDDAPLRLLDLAGDVPIVLVSRALVAFLRGARDEAAARYDELRERLADPDFAASSGVPTNLVPLVEAFGDPATAQVLAGLIAARPIAAGGAGVYCCGSMHGLLGRLAVVRGRLDEAVAHFEEALAVDTGTGARPAVVLDRLGLVDALVRRGRPVDLPRAAGAAGAARQEAARLGMPGPARSAVALLATVSAARRLADPLTGREREIAGLVAAALTNRQIADRLVLSERTVETHVRHILTKLGAANRTEIAVLTSSGA